MINIAIDGPSGAGKSTLSRRAADTLGFLYVDTGALYRAIGLAAIRAGLSADDAAGFAAIAGQVSVTLSRNACGQQTLLDGEDVTRLLHTERVGLYASAVSAVPAVRAALLDIQRAIARGNDVIMDGRDIATVVLPDAAIKIFLTAALSDRAKRRYTELRARGEAVTYADVLEDMRRRDLQDTTRAIAPLRQHPDAVLLDTTGNTFEQSLALLVTLIKERMSSCFTE